MKSSIRLSSLLCLCLLLASCSFLIDIDHPKDCTPLFNDESRLINPADSYFYRARDFDPSSDEVSLSFRTFSGLDTLHRITIKWPCLLSLGLDVLVDSDQYKLVLVDAERQKVLPLSQGSFLGSRLIYLPAGTHTLRAVGCSVSGRVIVKFAILGDR
jgi:hypothetical protein